MQMWALSFVLLHALPNRLNISIGDLEPNASVRYSSANGGLRMSRVGRIGAFKPVKTAGMSVDEAEALAAVALSALAEDPARLTRFMADTGLSPQELAARAGDRDVLTAVLEHVAGDESLLLVVTANARAKPEAVMHALHLLQTPGHWST
jgi:Protein of unknown function (DUF3572)